MLTHPFHDSPRPLRLFVLAFLAGVLALQRQPSLPQAYTGVVVGIAIALTLYLISGRVRRSRFVAAGLATLLLGLAVGFGYSQYRGQSRLADAIDATSEGVDIAVVGVVHGLPQRTDRGVRFTFEVETALPWPDGTVPKVPSRVSLTWYHEAERRNRAAQAAPTLSPGERWQLMLRLRAPHGFANPHGFDFELWALERNLRATGYVRTASGSQNQRLAATVPGFMHWIDRLRGRLAERIRSEVPGPQAGVLIALTIGEQSAISPDEWRTFWRTGVGHLMSISGLHITMLAALAAWLARWLWLRIPRAALALPARTLAALVGALTATFYALIAGFSVPTQRTLFMILVVAAAVLTRQHIAATRVLLFAVLVVLTIDPWAALSPGFWLSFGAVAAIFYLALGRRAVRSPVAAGARTQIAVTILMVPAGLMLFQEVSLVSPIANALAIPVVSLAVVPLSLLGAFFGATPMLSLAEWLMGTLMVPLRVLASLPDATWQSHAPHPLAVALALAAGACFLAPRAVPARWLALPFLLPMFIIRPAPPNHGEARVTMLDVGQGLAVVVQTANHALIYDTGASFGPDNDAGSRVVVPYLRGQGITKLDKVIVTHDDDDHYGGAISILNARKPSAVLSSLQRRHPVIAAADKNGIPHRRCVAGQTWEWDGVAFEMLHPTDDGYAPPTDGTKPRRDNDMGCVVEVTTRAMNLLLTADIEARSERELVDRLGRGLQADVLLMPHHGSKTSSTPEFLAAVKPDLAILSVGYRNRFRHPHADVMRRYADAGVPVFRSDEGGALTFTLPAAAVDQPIRVSEYRRTARRYWRSVPSRGALSDE